MPLAYATSGNDNARPATEDSPPEAFATAIRFQKCRRLRSAAPQVVLFEAETIKGWFNLFPFSAHGSEEH